jgi:hypothetical protein
MAGFLSCTAAVASFDFIKKADRGFNDELSAIRAAA